MATLPSLTSKYTNFIKPRKLAEDDKPLRLVIEQGRRRFNVTLKLADNEIGSKISLRHLAEMVYCHTGIVPKEQKFYYKGFTWENPEMGPWSPSLRSLGVKNGDKIQLVSFHHAYPDWAQVESLDIHEKEIAKLRKQLGQIFYHVQGTKNRLSTCPTKDMAETMQQHGEIFHFLGWGEAARGEGCKEISITCLGANTLGMLSQCVKSTTLPKVTPEPAMSTFGDQPKQESLKSDFTLTGVFESQDFSIHFSNPATATVADLAHVVYSKTGIVPHRQRLVFKGIIFDPPDTDVWAPLLEDLNFKSGDKVEVSRSARPLGEEDAANELERISDIIHKLGLDADELVSKRDRVQQGYMEGGNQVMALTFLRRDFENIKEKLMENVQVLNSLNFDHRNALGQAKRRELVDLCQRQIDKCTDMSAFIFHKLAQAHYLSNVGKIYTHDFRLAPSRNKWAKKKP